MKRKETNHGQDTNRNKRKLLLYLYYMINNTDVLESEKRNDLRIYAQNDLQIYHDI